MSKPYKSYINSATALEAFKFFLLRERARHQKDIDQIDEDLESLFGVDIVSEDFDTWIEIHRREENT